MGSHRQVGYTQFRFVGADEFTNEYYAPIVDTIPDAELARCAILGIRLRNKSHVPKVRVTYHVRPRRYKIRDPEFTECLPVVNRLI